jgi:pilus assembly protein Flp/PilA
VNDVHRLVGVVKALYRDEEGATMVEYGLMVALIAIVAMAGAEILGVNVDTIFDTAATAISGAAG